MRGKFVLVAPCEHAEAAFDRIARDRIAHRLRNGEPDASRCAVRLDFPDTIRYEVVHDEVVIGHPSAAAQYGYEIAVAPEPFQVRLVWWDSGGESLAALGAATVDECAAGTRAHAGAEAVLHVTTTVVRLECPLHSFMLPLLGRWVMRSYMTSLETISTNLPIPLYHHARTVGDAAYDTPGDVVETPSAVPTNLFSRLGKAP